MELYHVYNRGVDKRNIFLDDRDRARFVHDLFEFNDTKNAGSTYYSFRRDPGLNLGFVNPEYRRERLVDIHGWCLMQNHYHLLLSERIEGGIVLFLRKLNVGYANYFNERYERSGALFQGRTKKKLVGTNTHFLHILHYIHLNPLDFLKTAEGWRNRRLGKHASALKHLNGYRWSSFRDYTGSDNFPSLLTTSLFKPNLDYSKILNDFGPEQIGQLAALTLE